MSGEVKKQEYWIGHHTDGDAFILDKPKKNWQPQKHVINSEYVSAIESDNKAMREALEFYGNKTNWKRDYHAQHCGIEEWQYSLLTQDLEEQNEATSYGGKRARQTLSNLRGKYE